MTIVHQTSNAETFARPLCGAVGWMGADVDCPKCLRAMLATERTRRESAERERDELREKFIDVSGKYAEAVEKYCDAADLLTKRAETINEQGRAVTHWRTQAADMEFDRDRAQAAELRQLKINAGLVEELQAAKSDAYFADLNVESLKAELQAARIPDAVRETIREALAVSWIEDDPDGQAAIAWIEGAK